MRKMIALVLLVLAALTATAWAGISPRIVVNGREVQSDVPATIIEGRTMVPLRVISESIGAKVSWDPATSSVTVTTGKTAAELKPELQQLILRLNELDQALKPALDSRDMDLIIQSLRQARESILKEMIWLTEEERAIDAAGYLAVQSGIATLYSFMAYTIEAEKAYEALRKQDLEAAKQIETSYLLKAAQYYSNAFSLAVSRLP